jgi:hypothetical protein
MRIKDEVIKHYLMSRSPSNKPRKIYHLIITVYLLERTHKIWSKAHTKRHTCGHYHATLIHIITNLHGTKNYQFL